MTNLHKYRQVEMCSETQLPFYISWVGMSDQAIEQPVGWVERLMANHYLT